MAPAPSPESLSDRTLDLLEWLVKFTTALGALWLFLEKVAKPFTEWNDARRVAQIRRALKPEIDAVARITEVQEESAAHVEAMCSRQEVIFDDLDLVLKIVLDNRDRIDETNDLLDAAGFTTDRRFDDEHRREVNELLALLRKRRQDRKRELEARNEKPKPSLDVD